MPTVQTEAAVDVYNEMVRYQRQIQEILPVDVTLLMILLVAILVLIIYGTYRLIKRREVRTILILEFGDGKRTCSVHSCVLFWICCSKLAAPSSWFGYVPAAIPL